MALQSLFIRGWKQLSAYGALVYFLYGLLYLLLIFFNLLRQHEN